MPSRVRAGRVISRIGEKAGVKVVTTTRSVRDAKSGAKHAAETVKYASAHDLRRSFGERWAPRVMPQVLMELMRHESIETTLKYYVGLNAKRTAGVLWAAHKAATGSVSGSTSVDSFSAPSRASAVTANAFDS